MSPRRTPDSRTHGHDTRSSTHPKRPEPIVPGVWRIGGGSWNGHAEPLSAEIDGNVYLIRTDGAGILIDCGTTASAEAVSRNLESIDQEPAELTDLILSHSHWDHSEAATHWQTLVPSLLVHLNSVGRRFLDASDHRLVGYQLQPPPHAFEPFRVDHSVDDCEIFELGSATITAYHLPGHTPDSTLYAIEYDDLVIGICGDIAFQRRAEHGSVLGQLCTLWLSNLDDYVESLERMRALPIDILLPGHGSVVVGRAQVEAAVESTLGLARLLAGDLRLRESVGV